MSIRNIIRIIVTSVFMAVTVGASAGLITQTSDFDEFDESIDGTQDGILTLNKFNPALGMLQSVRLEATITATAKGYFAAQCDYDRDQGLCDGTPTTEGYARASAYFSNNFFIGSLGWAPSVGTAFNTSPFTWCVGMFVDGTCSGTLESARTVGYDATSFSAESLRDFTANGTTTFSIGFSTDGYCSFRTDVQDQTCINESKAALSARVTYSYMEASVPEPATLALMTLGLAGIGYSRKRKAA